ncbi:unnamed protein product [Symbiodinium necroappetens]|uniref:WAT1-related protein n=1 Tax=Symbiodinium necroappetens TaxID=1628268 RepID=A0A812QN88_9DINO|nr:unnamed protein product [Symbiodinium necroappetens]
MAIAAGSLNTQCWFIEFVCPPDVGSTAQCGKKPTSCTAWSVPPEAVLPLVYWILFNSMAAYFLITWANRYARAGFVLAYTALQPFTSTVLTAALVVSGRFPSLSLPGWNALGGLGVVAGMLCILWDGKRQHEHDTAGHEREVPLNQARQVLPDVCEPRLWMASVVAVYGPRTFNPVLNLAVLQHPEHGQPLTDAQDRRMSAARGENDAGRDGELLLEDRDLLAPKAKEAEAEPAEEWCSSRSPSAGTDKDAKGHICWTPLHFAARERHADCVELLLKTGAGFEQQLHAVGMASFCGAVERRPAVFVLRILRHPQVTGSTL